MGFFRRLINLPTMGLALAAFTFCPVPPVWAATTPGFIEVIATSSDMVPGGTQAFTGFGAPWINDSGQVAFRAELSPHGGGGESEEGIFIRDRRQGVEKIAQRFDFTPRGDVAYLKFGDPMLNNAGQVAFGAEVSGLSTSGYQAYNAVFRADGPTGVVQIGGFNDPAPGGNGLITEYREPALNDAGQVVFVSELSGTQAGSLDAEVLYRWDDTHGLVQMLRGEDPAPRGNGDFAFFWSHPPRINSTGQIVTYAFLRRVEGDQPTYASNVLIEPDGTVFEINRYGEPTPGNRGPYVGGSIFTQPELNEAGQVLFQSAIGPYRGPDTDYGVFVGDATNGVRELVRDGDTVPGGDGEFSFLSIPAINDSGVVAIGTGRTNNSGGLAENLSLHLFEPGQDARAIAVEGQAMPDGDGVIDQFSYHVINNAGQVAFQSRLRNTADPAHDQAILLYSDDAGIVTLVRSGEQLAGSTISLLSLVESTNDRTRRNYLPLNERGDIVFWFELEDGRTGLALWSAFSGVAGDYDNSGQVGQGDLDLVLQNWGDNTDVTGIPAGWVNDLPQGQIEQTELDGILQNWGETAAPDFRGTMLVPEPALAVPLLMMAAARHRR